MVLEAVYEQDFLHCSYGFRPGRSAHQALEALQHQLWCMDGGWVLEVDIQKFFDTLDHGHLREILRRRVRDGVLLRLIGKWLNAGVLEDGAVSYPEVGTPQGGVISPLLANIFLHEVLDVWFELEVKPRLQGQAFLVRYADDFVVVFSHEEDARRVLDVLPKRFGKYGLTLHPDKTRLVEFRRPDRPSSSEDRSDRRPGTFDLLGFTHFWGLSRRGQVGGQAQDRVQPFQPCAEADRRLVSAASAPGGRTAAADARAEAARSLRVLRHDGELRGDLPFPRARHRHLAQVARASLPTGGHHLGLSAQAAGALPASTCTGREAVLTRVANPCHEEPDAGVPHVRICGGPGRETSRGYPSVFAPCMFGVWDLDLKS